jgi:hypothetical protein
VRCAGVQSFFEGEIAASGLLESAKAINLSGGAKIAMPVSPATFRLFEWPARVVDIDELTLATNCRA